MSTSITASPLWMPIFLQRAGRLIDFLAISPKVSVFFATVHMLPHERDAIRLRLGDFVQHVERVVEVFRHVHVEVFQIIFIRTKLGLVQKLLVKTPCKSVLLLDNHCDEVAIGIHRVHGMGNGGIV